MGPYPVSAGRTADHADVETAWQHAIAPGSVDLVPGIKLGPVGQEIEPELGAVVARGERAHAGRSNQYWDPAIQVVQQQHTGDRRAGVDRAADQTVAIDDGVANAHAIVPSEINERAPEEGTPRIGNYAARHVMERRLVDRIQQQPKMFDLVFERLGAPLPLLEFLVLGLQAVDLGKSAGVGARMLQSVAAKNGRHGRSFEQRRR